MPNSDFTIDWKMPAPTCLKPESYTVWRESNILQLPERQSELERNMNLPAGTLAVLNKAFSSKYKRNQGWLFPGAGELPAALEMAARIFKRGVYAGLEEFKGHDQESSGSYQICFNDTINLEDYNSDEFFFVIDRNVEAKWASKIPHNSARMSVEASEIKKNLDTCSKICEEWSKHEQASCAVVIGGGIVADIASFAAHLLDKDFVLIPSTILAMVDACVGGKTGVNFPPFGKNQIGAFAFPAKVHIFMEWLSTLSERELRAGIAECLKHALIAGDDILFKDLSKILEKKEYTKISDKLSKIIRVKSEIIARDPEEKDERASLNLGHTLAHALEAASQYSSKTQHILHGEAVGLGLLFTMVLSKQLGVLSNQRFMDISKTIAKCKIVDNKSSYAQYFDAFPSLTTLLDYIEGDKKNFSTERGVSSWVLLSDNGIHSKENQFTHPVTQDQLTKCWEEFNGIISSL